MNKTHTPKANEGAQWFFVDVEGKILGKVATEIAKLLLGKDTATYTPGVFSGNHVVVTNAEKVAVTGNKVEDKTYYRHSDYPGALKQETLAEVLEKYPERAVERAVKGMLPGTKLRKKYMANLHVYVGPEHPHEAQIDKN